jgi:hypothetical protein
MLSDDLNALLAEMGRVLDQLAALPDDAFDDRMRLQSEQERLRAALAILGERATVDRPSLEAELEGLLARWDALQSQRIDVVMQSGGGSFGGDAFSGAQAVELNRKIDASHGREAIEVRIAEIRQLLADTD